MNKLLILPLIFASTTAFAREFATDTSLISQTDLDRVELERKDFKCSQDETCKQIRSYAKDVKYSDNQYDDCDDDDDDCRDKWSDRKEKDINDAVDVGDKAIKDAEIEYNRKIYKLQQMNQAVSNHGSGTAYEHKPVSDSDKMQGVKSGLQNEIDRINGYTDISDEQKQDMIANATKRFSNHQGGIMPNTAGISKWSDQTKTNVEESVKYCEENDCSFW